MSKQFQIGLATVVLLVALRLALGCHFLYEGVWKIGITMSSRAEPFLTQAKGPLPAFSTRCSTTSTAGGGCKGPAAHGRGKEPGEAVAAVKTITWPIAGTASGSSSSPAIVPRRTIWPKKAEDIFKAHREAAEKWLAEVKPDIDAHFAAADRFEAANAHAPDTAFQREQPLEGNAESPRRGEGLAHRTRRARRRLQTRPAGLDSRRETEGRLPGRRAGTRCTGAASSRSTSP